MLKKQIFRKKSLKTKCRVDSWIMLIITPMNK